MTNSPNASRVRDEILLAIRVRLEVEGFRRCGRNEILTKEVADGACAWIGLPAALYRSQPLVVLRPTIGVQLEAVARLFARFLDVKYDKCAPATVSRQLGELTGGPAAFSISDPLDAADTAAVIARGLVGPGMQYAGGRMSLEGIVQGLKLGEGPSAYGVEAMLPLVLAVQGRLKEAEQAMGHSVELNYDRGGYGAKLLTFGRHLGDHFGLSDLCSLVVKLEHQLETPPNAPLANNPTVTTSTAR